MDRATENSPGWRWAFAIGMLLVVVGTAVVTLRVAGVQEVQRQQLEGDRVASCRSRYNADKDDALQALNDALAELHVQTALGLAAVPTNNDAELSKRAGRLIALAKVIGAEEKPEPGSLRWRYRAANTEWLKAARAAEHPKAFLASYC